MTLGEFMDNADPDTVYSIGASASYLFIGTKEQWFQEIARIERKAIVSINTSIYNLKHNLSKIPPKLAAESVFGFCDLLGYISSYTRIADREVLDVYDREEGGSAVIIQGREIGRYWLIDEAEEDRRN